MLLSVDIETVEPLADGAAFGAAGAYERVIGTAHGEVDPEDPANRGIVNIDKAPLNARGRVEYSTVIFILRPKDPLKGNGRILYEVNNRGRKMLFGNIADGNIGDMLQHVVGITADYKLVIDLRRFDASTFYCGADSDSRHAGGFQVVEGATHGFADRGASSGDDHGVFHDGCSSGDRGCSSLNTRRRQSGTGTGRRPSRSTNTWTKRPVAQANG